MLARDFIRRFELSGGQRLTELRRFYNELLRGGADVGAQPDPHALIKMCDMDGEGDVQECRDLIDGGGIDIDEQDDDGDTALMNAASFGPPALVEMLLEKEADKELRNNEGKTALMYAAWVGPKRGVVMLLEEGADIDVQDDDGNTALILATSQGRRRVVEELVNNGANIAVANNAGNTALQLAQEMNYADIVTILQGAGGGGSTKDDDGEGQG